MWFRVCGNKRNSYLFVTIHNIRNNFTANYYHNSNYIYLKRRIGAGFNATIALGEIFIGSPCFTMHWVEVESPNRALF